MPELYDSFCNLKNIEINAVIFTTLRDLGFPCRNLNRSVQFVPIWRRDVLRILDPSFVWADQKPTLKSRDEDPTFFSTDPDPDTAQLEKYFGSGSDLISS